jgi:hypothetical protein
MSKKRIAMICALVLLPVYISCQSANAEVDYREKVPHISAVEALALYNSGKLILMDVHGGQNNNYRSCIVGALHLPPDKVDKVKLNIPAGMLIGVF